MDNRQRNILIIIALLLLYFYFRKKPAKKIETYPPYTGTCPYMLSEDRQTPTPFIDASTDYLVGSDPELKGDFKLYYWCCPKKMAVIVWQPFEDPLQYTNPEFDIQTGDNIVTTVSSCNFPWLHLSRNRIGNQFLAAIEEIKSSRRFSVRICVSND